MKYSDNLLFYLLCTSVSFLIILFFALPTFSKGQNSNAQNLQNEYINPEDILTNEEVLKQYLVQNGPKTTLATLLAKSAETGIDCHQSAHKAGRFAITIMSAQEAFKNGSGECHSGYYHGTTEGYFALYGTVNLEENLNTLCTQDLNTFFRHQCFHGVGHGLMAWSNYQITEALSSCDQLKEDKDQSSCTTGVFMENYTGAFTKEEAQDPTHVTTYLSQDPQFPCNAVAEKYQDECYFLQTSRMLQIFGADFEKVAGECNSAPEKFQSLCFASMGRDVSAYTRPNFDKSISLCSFTNTESFQIECLNGAVQDYFWDPTGADSAIEFCKKLTNQAQKNGCYETIIGRSGEILTQEQKIEFCEKIEKGFKQNCQ